MIVPAVAAQPAAAGTVEGRFVYPANGENIERARVRIERATLETFTDAGGQYRATTFPPARRA